MGGVNLGLAVIMNFKERIFLLQPAPKFVCRPLRKWEVVWVHFPVTLNKCTEFPSLSSLLSHRIFYILVKWKNLKMKLSNLREPWKSSLSLVLQKVKFKFKVAIVTKRHFWCSSLCFHLLLASMYSILSCHITDAFKHKFLIFLTSHI